jgi:co-chaperonin GroES (HSP10)
VDTHKAEVVAVGDEVTKGVKEGDIVLHTVFAGNKVEHDQEEFVILEEEDILAVIDRS